MKHLLSSIVILAAALSSQAVKAAKAGKPPSDAPATTTIRDIDENTGLVNRIGNDSLGPYVNGADSVSSVVQGIGDWVLDTKPSATRRVRIDLGDPVAGSGPNPPFQSANVPARFISKCASWNIFMPGLSVGQQVNCPLSVSIEYSGETYALRSNENFGGTEAAQWTCLARNSTKCMSFEMIPSIVQADGQRKIVMQLVKPAAKRVPEQLLGQYYMSFDITVKTP